MGSGYVPGDLVDPRIQPAWKNIFEHSTLVQFDHRMLVRACHTGAGDDAVSHRALQAYASVIASIGLFVFCKRFPLSRASRVALAHMPLLTAVQARQRLPPAAVPLGS
jgi:hypothetical protein